MSLRVDQAAAQYGVAAGDIPNIIDHGGGVHSVISGGKKFVLTEEGGCGISCVTTDILPADPGTSQGADDLDAVVAIIGGSNAAAQRRAVAYIRTLLEAGTLSHD